jgi:hypothetical protein
MEYIFLKQHDMTQSEAVAEAGEQKGENRRGSDTPHTVNLVD